MVVVARQWRWWNGDGRGDNDIVVVVVAMVMVIRMCFTKTKLNPKKFIGFDSECKIALKLS